jgi:hypothetical protein
MLASKVLHRLTTAATGTICTQTFQNTFLQDTKTDLENVVHDDHTSEQYNHRVLKLEHTIVSVVRFLLEVVVHTRIGSHTKNLGTLNLSEGSVEQCEVGCHELEDEYLDGSAHLKLSLCAVILELCQSQSDGGVEAVEYGNNHSIYRTHGNTP